MEILKNYSQKEFDKLYELSGEAGDLPSFLFMLPKLNALIPLKRGDKFKIGENKATIESVYWSFSDSLYLKIVSTDGFNHAFSIEDLLWAMQGRINTSWRLALVLGFIAGLSAYYIVTNLIL